MLTLRAVAVASTCVAVALTLSCAQQPLQPSTKAADAGGIKSSSKLAALHQEQIATPREASKLADVELARGVGSISDANRLHLMLFKAELSSATSSAERIRILNDAISVATKEEKILGQEADRGLASPLELLEAKSYRLGLQIKLAEQPPQ